MKFLVVAVFHGNIKALKVYLNSIDCAWRHAGMPGELLVLVGDNSPNKLSMATNLGPFSYQIDRVPVENNGYFRSARAALEDTVREEMGLWWVAVTNVDLELETRFFSELVNLNDSLRGQKRWVIPKVTDHRTGRSLNPYLYHRPSKIKLILLSVVFRFASIFKLWTGLSAFGARLRKKRAGGLPGTGQCYAGHGSFFLFHLSLPNVYTLLDYPPFLYGEELYVAEELRRAGVKKSIELQLGVYHIGSLTLNTFHARKITRWKSEANTFLLRRYFDVKVKK